MAFASERLIKLLSLVDRPHGDKVIARAKRAVRLPKLIRPLAAAAVAYLLAAIPGGPDNQAPWIAASVGMLTACVAFLTDAMPAIERRRRIICKIAAGLGLFVGLAVPLLTDPDVWTVLVSGFAGLVGTWLVTQVGLSLLAIFVVLLNAILRIFAAPIAVPVLAAMARSNNRALKKIGWTTSNGALIAEFNRDGIKQLNHANEPIFVSSPGLRAGGAALAAGIPLFTLSELSNSSLVNERMQDAYRTFSNADDTTLMHYGTADHPLMTFSDINPATGLPMLDGVGSVDMMGNLYGVDGQQAHSDLVVQHDSGMHYDGFDHNH